MFHSGHIFAVGSQNQKPDVSAPGLASPICVGGSRAFKNTAVWKSPINRTILSSTQKEVASLEPRVIRCRGLDSQNEHPTRKAERRASSDHRSLRPSHNDSHFAPSHHAAKSVRLSRDFPVRLFAIEPKFKSGALNRL